MHCDLDGHGALDVMRGRSPDGHVGLDVLCPRAAPGPLDHVTDFMLSRYDGVTVDQRLWTPSTRQGLLWTRRALGALLANTRVVVYFNFSKKVE